MGVLAPIAGVKKGGKTFWAVRGGWGWGHPCASPPPLPPPRPPRQPWPGAVGSPGSGGRGPGTAAAREDLSPFLWAAKAFFFLLLSSRLFLFSFKLQISCKKRKKSKKHDSALQRPPLRGWSLPLVPLPTALGMIKLFFFPVLDALDSFHLVPSPAIFQLALPRTPPLGRRREGNGGARAPVRISRLLNSV